MLSKSAGRWRKEEKGGNWKKKKIPGEKRETDKKKENFNGAPNFLIGGF